MTGYDPSADAVVYTAKNQLAAPPDTIEVSIDELVLYGFRPADQYRISEALTAELTRLFTKSGVAGTFDLRASPGKPELGASASGFELDYLNAGSFQVAQDASPEWIGAQVAVALWERVALVERGAQLDENHTPGSGGTPPLNSREDKPNFKGGLYE